MQLFTVGKIGMYCEGIAHRIERRRGDEVKVVDLTLKIEPFTPQLASALNQDEYGFIKRMLFKHGDGSPIGDLRAVEFIPPGDRQRVTCFASSDTEVPSIALDQCKVTKLRARSQKDAAGWVLYLHLSFGPLGRTELEYVNAFYTEQRCLTFDAAEPSLDFEDDAVGDDLTDADEKARQAARPLPEWDDDEPVTPSTPDDSPATTDAKRSVGANRKLHSHQSKKKGAKKTRGSAQA